MSEKFSTLIAKLAVFQQVGVLSTCTGLDINELAGSSSQSFLSGTRNDRKIHTWKATHCCAQNPTTTNNV
jgi:hypothetical protein